MWAVLLDYRLPHDSDYARDSAGRTIVYSSPELARADCNRFILGPRTWLARVVELPAPDDDGDEYAFVVDAPVTH